MPIPKQEMIKHLVARRSCHGRHGQACALFLACRSPKKRTPGWPQHDHGNRGCISLERLIIGKYRDLGCSRTTPQDKVQIKIFQNISQYISQYISQNTCLCVYNSICILYKIIPGYLIEKNDDIHLGLLKYITEYIEYIYIYMSDYAIAHLNNTCQVHVI